VENGFPICHPAATWVQCCRFDSVEGDDRSRDAGVNALPPDAESVVFSKPGK